jgi:hypothetical protein
VHHGRLRRPHPLRGQRYLQHTGTQIDVCRQNPNVANRVAGTFCSAHNQCSSGWCDNWGCRDLLATCTSLVASCPSSTVCSVGSDCASGYCRQWAFQANACRRSSSDVNRFTGEWCLHNSHCASNDCSGYLCQAPHSHHPHTPHSHSPHSHHPHHPHSPHSHSPHSHSPHSHSPYWSTSCGMCPANIWQDGNCRGAVEGERACGFLGCQPRCAGP